MDSSFQDYKISINENRDVTICPIDESYDYCLLFMHGMSYQPTLYIKYFLSEPLKSATKNFKIVIPSAPIRKVTIRECELVSWFDLKTYENCFSRPFEESFSATEVKGRIITSSSLEYYQILKSIVEREVIPFNQDYQKIFLSGFSQGCGLSIYTAYSLPQDVAGVVGLGGYYLDITNYTSARNIPILTIHGLKDEKRLWSQVKQSYDKFQGSDKVKLVHDMGHEIDNLNARQLFAQFLIHQTNLHSH